MSHTRERLTPSCSTACAMSAVDEPTRSHPAPPQTQDSAHAQVAESRAGDDFQSTSGRLTEPNAQGLRSLLRQPALERCLYPYPSMLTVRALASLLRVRPSTSADESRVLKELVKVRNHRRAKLTKAPLHAYFVFHKPPGCISARPSAAALAASHGDSNGNSNVNGGDSCDSNAGSEGRGDDCTVRQQTIYDALPAGFPHCPFAGRLDRQTEGIVLFTDDGALLTAMTRAKPPRASPACVTGKPDVIASVTPAFVAAHTNQNNFGEYKRRRTEFEARGEAVSAASMDAPAQVPSPMLEDAMVPAPMLKQENTQKVYIVAVRGLYAPRDDAERAWLARQLQPQQTCSTARPSRISVSSSTLPPQEQETSSAPAWCTARQQLEALCLPLRYDDPRRNRNKARSRGGGGQGPELGRVAAGSEVVSNEATITSSAAVRLLSVSPLEKPPADSSAIDNVGGGPHTANGCCDCELEFVLEEGKYRQIRRLCNRSGLAVLSLRRVRFGPLLLGDLPRGRARGLSTEEVAQCYASVALHPGTRMPVAMELPLKAPAPDMTLAELNAALCAPARLRD